MHPGDFYVKIVVRHFTFDAICEGHYVSGQIAGDACVGCKTVNIEAGRPSVEVALQRLSQELRLGKANRVGALKVIHGYGSTGSGGAIRDAARRLLAERRRAGMIRDFVGGDEFSAFSPAGRRAVELLPELRRDTDYGRGNDGITIVVL